MDTRFEREYCTSKQQKVRPTYLPQPSVPAPWRNSFPLSAWIRRLLHVALTLAPRNSNSQAADAVVLVPEMGSRCGVVIATEARQII